MGAQYHVEEIPESLLKKAEAFRMQLVELVAESDDEILVQFLDGDMPTAAQLKAGLRKATLDLKLFPVLCGSAFKNKGIQTLLDAVVDYLPSPLDIPPIIGLNPSDLTEQFVRHSDDSEPFSALGFKLINDQFGKLGFIRVYSGQLKTGDTVLNPRTGKTERVGRLVKMHANKREDITEIMAGDICACVGLKELKTGDTLCAPSAPIALSAITFPDTVISVAIEPKTKADQEKMGMALAKLADEDPTFKVKTDEDSGQTIISGMGELHLEILVDRMKREHKVEANVGEPKVAFRETIRKESEAEGKYIRQTGGSGNYGHCKIRLKPRRTGQGLRVHQRYQGWLDSEGVHQAHRSGHSGSARCGILAGYPVVDVTVTLYDGSYHDVDSNGNGIQDCRFDGLQGGRKEGQSGASGAGDGRRSDRSGGIRRHDYRRHQLPARTDRKPGACGGFAAREGDRSAQGNVRLCERHSFVHAGPGIVFNAVRPLRRGPADDRGRNHRARAGK